jgi:hypothetical protein
LNYAKLAVEITDLHLADLDKIDNLDIPDELGHSAQTVLQRLASLTPFGTHEGSSDESI